MTEAQVRDPYAGFDPLDVPAYSIALAAYYVRMSAETLKTWVFGRDSGKQHGQRSPPLIDIPDLDRGELSFWNLVEAWMLCTMRISHSMFEVRNAIRYVSEHLKVPRPLAHRSWKSDGMRLFVEYKGKHLQTSRGRGGQMVQDWYAAHLKRIRWDASDMAEWLFPFTRPDGGIVDPPTIVAITPRIAFGQPIIERAGVPTEAVFDRWRGGDDREHLAKDYGITAEEVDEALRWETYLIEAKAKAA